MKTSRVTASATRSMKRNTQELGIWLFALAIGLAAVATPLAQAQTFTLLYNFDNNLGTAGGYPGSPTIDSSGNLYGTTATGGSEGYGTVWKLTPSGRFTVLHAFYYPTDGGAPGGLHLASSGNFYGFATTGGPDCSGTLWMWTPSGTFTVLHCFTNSMTDGGTPTGLLLASSGNLYGTTSTGGAGHDGTVWELTPSGTYTILYSFSASTNAGFSPTGLIIDSSGNLYGITTAGSADLHGSLYKLTPSGTLTMLHDFNQQTDGAPPTGVLLAPSGNFYGTSLGGGAHLFGTAWELTPSGTFTVLHNFYEPTDGADPSGLHLAPSGNFYGMSKVDGPHDYGTVWELTPSGTFTVLHAFPEYDGATGAAGEPSGLLLAPSGNLYGTSFVTALYYGSLWELVP